ncbi:hypothetical protein Angca_001161, partial [Angiostrongylus cantonensis]
PHSIFLLCSRNSVIFILNPYYVIIAGTPFIAQLRIILTLTTFVATERILALFCPLAFRKLSSRSHAVFCLLFTVLIAVLDIIFEFSLLTFNNVSNCPSAECF